VALIATGSLILTLRFGGAAKPGEAVSVARDPTSYGPKAAASPTAVALGRARSFARGRRGLVSFAVVDTSGTLACFRCRVSYHSASVVKAMLLVSYLNQLSTGGEPLPADHKAYLDSMIRVSDNDAATAIYAHVGEEGLNELAWQAHMADFRISGSWGSASITAADQARFFAALNELIAPEYRMYVRDVLSSIAPRQSWGIPEVSRPEWDTFFKGGWLTTRRGSLVHQVARLESDGSSMAIAVLTDGAPSDAYGRETIRGIASRLLGR
jgi:Beta-lactamase enzyme family